MKIIKRYSRIHLLSTNSGKPNSFSLPLSGPILKNKQIKNFVSIRVKSKDSRLHRNRKHRVDTADPYCISRYSRPIPSFKNGTDPLDRIINGEESNKTRV
ncbi:hypothetical protein DLM78_21835 [Leptospira stimsonii]|uniref:Uncharacterized protein n=1 Tax=Leptospira stimsonii TaxID=2202203 RepID=A0A8B3CJ34_9LEPT|nr:hypothetical protein DLM78_21835 [Leptospira stimsonii]